MLFTEFRFWIFLTVVFFLVRSLRHRGQNRVLLAASLIFYGAWDWRYLLLMILSTVIAYVAGLWLTDDRSARQRQVSLYLGIGLNLAILATFKYYDFFVSSFFELFHITSASDQWLLKVTLPIGVSFYTFQSVSYILDIHWKRIKLIPSFWDFALYHTFFPQLVAGPIERAEHLLPQVLKERDLSFAKVKSGVLLICWGLFEKMIVADTLAQPVNLIFDSPNPTSFEIYVATLGFAFQIFGDFAGYTDIARGVARLLGFELMLNFNLPYFAKNPSDFWHRWHISLSTWLRDYLYVPLGGNRHGTWKTYRNLMLTMVLGGLWHGAAWNFVLWGCYHGALLSIHRMLTRGKQVVVDSAWVSGLKIVGMFQLTLFGWFLFRIHSWSEIQRLSHAFVHNWHSPETAISIIKYGAAPVALLLLVQLLQYLRGKLDLLDTAPWQVQTAFASLCFWYVFLCDQGAGLPFIYFQF